MVSVILYQYFTPISLIELYSNSIYLTEIQKLKDSKLSTEISQREERKILTINENLISLFRIKSKMVWSLIIVNRILLLDNFLLCRCLSRSNSKRSVPSSPPPPHSPSQGECGGKESFNAIFKYQGNYTAVLVIFPLCNGIILFQHGHYLISARISYFSTKYEKKIWTLWQQNDSFSNEIYIFTTHNKHIKRTV